ncbi:hypothetical protein SUGI_0263060 [Cryptomeria japonica]|nr:hypothetical protein SUGI_0263060 [Cryptomeria japonica]
MGSSRFRLFHVMPNVWFYKLRDIGRFKESEGRLQRNNSIRDESDINGFPRCGYHFEVNLKASEDQPADHPKSQMKKNSSKHASSAFIDSRISIGCSCTTTLGFMWNSSDRNEYASSESSEEERPVRYYSEQPVLVLQQQNDTDREFKEKLDGSGLESKSGIWRQPSKHVLQYIYNNAAGLPSPVQELDDGGSCGHSGQPDQQPVSSVKGMFELVEHPLTIGASASASGSSSDLHHNDQVSQGEESFLCMNKSQDHCSGLERKNVGRRRRNAEPGNEKIQGKQKQISVEITEPIRKKVDAGQIQKQISNGMMNFSSSNVVDGPRKPGKSIPHLSIRTSQNNTRASSSKLCVADDNTETLFRRSHSTRLKGETSTNKNFKVDDDKAVPSAKSLSASHLFCSDKSSSKCAEPDDKSAIFDSFVEMKSSYNPHKDFRESMLEMITEKDIHGSQDLEKLLECYLSLNSSEYHDIILKVFEQVMSDLKGIKS